ncbi:MAG: hypothetical protein CMI26_08995 [Opitutae bacterium]|nr:hypothetical protein [Opitutae bacterium]
MKILPLLLGIASIFFFSGCGGESTTAVDDANDTAAVETSTPNVPVTPKLPPLAPAIELAGAETQPFAYLKTIALPKLLQKAVAVAQAVKPDPQIAMVSALAGMALGDPGLTSIDADAPMTLFVFDEFEGGDDVTFVLAVKLTKDSPIRKQSETLDLALADRDGWTLATKAPELFSQVKDWSPLLDIAEQSPQGDLEVGILFQPIWQEMPKIKGTVEGGLTMSPFDEETQANLAKLIHVILDEVGSLDAAKFNLFLSTEEIVARFAMSAKSGTALSTMFSSKANGGNPSVARYVESGGFLDAVGDYEMSGLIAYVNHVIDKFSPVIEGELKTILIQYKEMMAEMSKLYGGQLAMRYDFSAESNAMNIVQIGTTKASHEEFGKLFTEGLKLSQDLIKHIDFIEDMGIKYELEHTEGKPVEGVPTYRYSMKMDMGEANASLFPTELPYSNMTYLYAVTNDHYIMAMDETQLGSLIQVVKGGNGVKNSLAESLSLQPGQSARWSVDVKKYIKLIIGSMGGLLDDESNQKFSQAIEQLEIAPITGSLSVDDGRFSTDVSIPLKTIRAGVDYFESEKAALVPEAIPDEIPAPSPKLEE